MRGLEAGRNQPSAPAGVGIGLRLARWALAAAALAGLLALGFQREAKLQGGAAPPPARFLRFGELAPQFSLPTAAGGELASDSTRGKWTLLVFCSSSCPYSQKALKALALFQARWRERLSVLCIVPETRWRAKRVSRWCRFPVLVDPGRKVYGSYGNPFQSPSFVLLDEQGRVRFVEQGYRTDCTGKSSLIGTLSSFFAGKGSSLERLQPATDGVVLIGDSRRRLSDLWTGCTLVLVFVAPGQPESMGLVGRLAGFEEGPDSMRFLFVSPGKPDSPRKRLPIEGRRFLAGWDETGELADAYEAATFPKMLMIRDGFFLGQRGEVCPRCNSPWARVAETALFTCSPQPKRGRGDRT